MYITSAGGKAPDECVLGGVRSGWGAAILESAIIR